MAHKEQIDDNIWLANNNNLSVNARPYPRNSIVVHPKALPVPDFVLHLNDPRMLNSTLQIVRN